MRHEKCGVKTLIFLLTICNSARSAPGVPILCTHMDSRAKAITQAGNFYAGFCIKFLEIARCFYTHLPQTSTPWLYRAVYIYIQIQVQSYTVYIYMGGMHGRWDCRGWGILNKHSKRKKFLNFLTLRHFVLNSTVQYVSHVVYKILFTVLFIYIYWTLVCLSVLSLQFFHCHTFIQFFISQVLVQQVCLTS